MTTILSEAEPRLAALAEKGDTSKRAVSHSSQKRRSGLCLLADNHMALAARALSAAGASRSLDLMYYLWHDDETGRYLAGIARDAADRGVRVRILLDDVSPADNDALIRSVGGHPNIEVRLFNRSWVRRGWVLHRIELVLRRSSMTRRMHNKAWIVDGETAIVGGRNIGDAYFGAADTNFRDLDLLISGRAVSDARDIFERFWACTASRPVKGETQDARSSATPRRSLGKGPPADISRWATLRDLVDDAGRMHWTDEAKIVSDPPRKVRGNGQKAWLIRSLLPVIEASASRVEIISPYFIPGSRGVRIMGELIRSGVDVAVLTNSLAATDVAAVHGAYAKYRRRLVARGVQLFELQPHAEPHKLSVLGSKGASLHTKAFTVDDTTGFVGSFNFDPRSTSLNTEMGVLFRHPSLVADISRMFRHEVSAEVSYRVSLSKCRLVWEGSVDGVARRFRSEPEAGVMRRFVAFAIRFLPVESEL